MMATCKKSYENTVYGTKYKINDIDVNVKAYGIIKGDDNKPIDLLTLFSDGNTGYNFYIGYNDLLELRFSKLVWIKDITFYLKKYESENKKGILQVKVVVYPDENLTPVDVFDYDLESKDNKYRIIFPVNSYVNILKYKSISLSIKWKDIGGNANGERIYLKNFKISFSDIVNFIPSISFDEIKTKCLSKRDKTGKIIYDDEYINMNEIRNLVFYAINGNKEAEQFLNNLNPSSAEFGETISAIHEWYMINKK